jgi:hypothetical protein
VVRVYRNWYPKDAFTTEKEETCCAVSAKKLIKTGIGVGEREGGQGAKKR